MVTSLQKLPCQTNWKINLNKTVCSLNHSTAYIAYVPTSEFVSGKRKKERMNGKKGNWVPHTHTLPTSVWRKQRLAASPGGGGSEWLCSAGFACVAWMFLGQCGLWVSSEASDASIPCSIFLPHGNTARLNVSLKLGQVIWPVTRLRCAPSYTPPTQFFFMLSGILRMP